MSNKVNEKIQLSLSTLLHNRIKAISRDRDKIKNLPVAL